VDETCRESLHRRPDGFVGLECRYSIDTDEALEQFKRDVLAKV